VLLGKHHRAGKEAGLAVREKNRKCKHVLYICVCVVTVCQTQAKSHTILNLQFLCAHHVCDQLQFVLMSPDTRLYVLLSVFVGLVPSHYLSFVFMSPTNKQQKADIPFFLQNETLAKTK
jgi:hypothetical protein